MRITKEEWTNYINGLELVSQKAKELTQRYIENHDVDTDEGRRALIDFCYGISIKYGEAAAEFACQMYDAISALEGAGVEPAEPASTATYQDVAKAVNGTIKNLLRAEIVAGAISRLVKLAGQDTTINNAIRDGALFAWIPVGDTCPYCLGIAAEGWKRATNKALKGGHAEHIHSNCNCAYSIKHESDTEYDFYRPEAYQALFEHADGDTPEEKLNSVRRMAYQVNKDRINAQKRSNYEKSKELESSQAEEIDVN